MGEGKNSVFGIMFGVLLAEGAPKVFKRSRKLLFRWRRFLTPVWIGFLVYLAAVILRWQAPAWWPVVLLFPVIGIGAAWAGPRLSDRASAVVMAVVPAGLDRGKDGVLDRPIERAYFASLLTFMGGYMGLRIIDGPSSLSGYMWLAGEVLWGGTWWYHRRVRVAGRADKFARKWHIISDKETCPFRLAPLAGSKVIRAEAMGKTSVLTIRLAPSQTADAVTHLTGALASFFNMRVGSVFAAPDDNMARNVVLTFLPKNPWKGKIDHPAPEPGTVSLAGLKKRFPMGLLAHGAQIIYELQHTLVVGSTGSGKSGWLNSLMMWLTACSDCIVLGIDMAQGATLGLWSKCLALPLATDVDAAIVILERVLGVIKDRESRLGLTTEDYDGPDDSFEPSKKTPWLVLVIEEFPDLLAEAQMTTKYDENGKAAGNMEKYVILLLSRIAKKARKCGIRMILASQNGTKVDMGSKEMQAQLRAIVGLNLDSGQSRNLWGDGQARGWKSTDLRLGQFLLKDDEHTTPDVAKGFWTEKKQRWEHAGKAADLHKALEPTAWAVLMGVIEITVDFIEGEIVPAQRGPEQAVLDYLRTEAQSGSRVEDIADVLTKAKEANGGGGPGTSRATIYRHLNVLAERGEVRDENGVWHAVAEPVRRMESEPGTTMVSIQGEQQA
jgi:hypothetical protein